ncbi:MAG: ABC transporter ATP-binding protein [Verrucomicrobiota bacterium]
MTAAAPQPLLKIDDLSVQFATGRSVTDAVQHVSFAIAQGETVAVVGESGSGKSVTALSLTRLLPSPPVRYPSGRILFEGEDLLQASGSRLREIRGSRIAYIFQEPGTSLNPVFTIGHQIEEAMQLHRPEVTDVRSEIVRALDLVGIREPEKRLGDYPHQLSGGMQQRAMIAMALSCRPRLLVADEPTTALDVTIQKQIMDLLRDLKRDVGMAILLITHNFGIITGIAERVVVMFRGRIVETGPTEAVLKNPRHPYTQALIACVPKPGARQRRLTTIDHAALEAAPAEAVIHD